jgi:amino acid permease
MTNVLELYIAICIFQYFWLLYSIARRMVPAYTNCDIQLQNCAPYDELKSPKHVEHLMINEDTSYEFVYLVDLLIYTLQ